MAIERPVTALVFDVFGTCVDWRGSIIGEADRWARQFSRKIDGAGLADAWRAKYQPALEEVRSGRRPFASLDVLHRESLDGLARRFGLEGLSEAALQHINTVWHRLNPWPDTVPGLLRLRSRYLIAPLSNGNMRLLSQMAKRAGMPWDLVLSGELFGSYKPEPKVYLGAAQLLGLPPQQVMMVAAHNADLAAAQALGLQTAFVLRPSEYGPGQKTDLKASGTWDVLAEDFEHLAETLGCP
ncbi:MAG: haloacid dehalogenase type II [Proteobacteria bacterium]|nr:haloacid dehalogenase type II [Pseudomonadota bacterium]MBI3496219.1 haloacid dehalogenase type II [Pseudomonadota bacterium]